jgi:hypothetical protein
MNNLKFKPEISVLVRTPRQQLEAIRPSLLRHQESMMHFKAGSPPMLTKPILLLEKLTGAMLGGIGVTALVGTILICGCMLILGPAFILELLTK